MKLAIICGAGNVSGKEIMTLELATGLRERNHDIRVVASKWGDGKFCERLHQLDLPHSRMRLGFISATLSLSCLWMTFDQLMHVPKLWFDFRRFLRRESPQQIIHTNWHHLLVLWPFLNPKRDWFWLHDTIPDKPQYRRVFRELDQRLKGWIPVSNAVRESLLQIGIPEEHIHVIHNGLEDPVKSKLNEAVADGPVRIGIAGQISPWKGHRELFAAFGILAGERPDVELHVFGTGPEPFQEELRQTAERTGFSDRVRWHGFVKERSKIYSKIDICVVPSLLPDSLPTTAIEAAFFSLPVVATCSGGLPEIVVDGETGFIVEIGSPQLLSVALRKLAMEPPLRLAMGATARDVALRKFAKKRFIDDFETLLSVPGVE